MVLIRREIAKIQQLLVYGEKKNRKAELCTPGAVLMVTKREVVRRGWRVVDGTKPSTGEEVMVETVDVARCRLGSSLAPLVKVVTIRRM